MAKPKPTYSVHWLVNGEDWGIVHAEARTREECSQVIRDIANNVRADEHHVFSKLKTGTGKIRTKVSYTGTMSNGTTVEHSYEIRKDEQS